MKWIVSTLLMILMTAQAVFAAEQVFFYHTDPAGTPLAMTDSTGKVVWKADYRPFGEEQSVTQTQTNDKRFIGKEKDEETGLSYFGARYENAKIGRFIAPDPVRAVDPKTSMTNEKLLLNPQRLNTYAYALNNPYRYMDPDGMAPILTAEDPFNNQRFSGGSIGNVAGESGFARAPMRGPSAVNTATEASSARGRVVLGHYPEYVEKANELNARRFTVPESVWNKMSESERWMANQKFLDRLIRRGDEVTLATPVDKVRPGSYFERELLYLTGKGYQFNNDSTKLIPSK